jgi:glycerol kinase
VWQLTGGAKGGQHLTDVTNASRTLLFNLRSLSWDEKLLDSFGVSRRMLPSIRPSVEPETYGTTDPSGPFKARIPICSVLGDQQAALFGQTCFDPGEAKNTYGTGCFLLVNTGTAPVESRRGLITTIGFQARGSPAVYALEGSVAVAGSLVQWLRDNFRIIENSSDIEKLAATVPDNGGIYIVPAFSGLFAPHWRADARGIIAGLTHATSRGHLARAVLEATAFQTREIFDTVVEDLGRRIPFLKVDGGMVVNQLLMQFQSDILGIPIMRSEVSETTSLGAAYGAGLASGFWNDLGELRKNWRPAEQWTCRMEEPRRKELLQSWKKAVSRSFNWL